MSSVPILMIHEISAADRLVTIDAARVIGYHVNERRPPDVVPPYKLKIDTYAQQLSANAANVSRAGSRTLFPVPALSGGGSVGRERRLGVPFAPHSHGQRHRLSGSLGDYSASSSGGTPRGGRRADGQTRRSSSSPVPPGASLRSPSGSRFFQDTASGASVERLLAETLEEDAMALNFGGMGAGLGGGATAPFHDGHGSDGLGPHLFAIHSESKLLFSCKHWDHSFKVCPFAARGLLPEC